jgi:hypothetical protein
MLDNRVDKLDGDGILADSKTPSEILKAPLLSKSAAVVKTWLLAVDTFSNVETCGLCGGLND